ncbi:MAG: polysaccharide biosynthesis C-terminal domain-containing protein [Candidatus Saccharibacteria bacterium]|nr:polysaccharide biosynthesis C-terminal domain-containing protein [Candidatus Saccharibacteria bacterium]
MNIIARQINRPMTLGSATVVIGASLFLGLILGIIRTKLINDTFNHWTTGAYFGAFKLPEFIFYTLAAGALSVSFIPVLSEKLQLKSRLEAWRLTSSILNAVALLMLALCLVMIIFPEPILKYIIVPGFSEARLEITAQIMRLAAIGPFVFSIASILSSVQQAINRFLYLAIAPIFYNLSIIASIYLFKDSMGIVCLGLGAAFGGVLNLMILGLGMNRLGFRHRWIIDFKDKAFKQVFKALPFRSFDQGIIYINSIVQTRLASSLSIHAITNFENALILYSAPISLLGVALGMAAFPRFASHLARGQPSKFKKDFLEILRGIFWATIPVVVVSYVSRDLMAKIIFSRGNQEIALIFGWLCLGILFRTLYAIISRFYYAQKDTKTPLIVTLIGFGVNICLSWYLSYEFGVIGFGMATSIVAGLEIAILIYLIHIRNPNLFNITFIKRLLHIIVVSFGTVAITFLLTRFIFVQAHDSAFDSIFKVGLIFSVVGLMHFGLSYLFKVPEAYKLLGYITRQFVRIKKIFYHDRGV